MCACVCIKRSRSVTQLQESPGRRRAKSMGCGHLCNALVVAPCEVASSGIAIWHMGYVPGPEKDNPPGPLSPGV